MSEDGSVHLEEAARGCREAWLAGEVERQWELVAAPGVPPPDTLARLETLADEVVCGEVPERFGAVGQFFADFDQVGDDEVVALLGAWPAGDGSAPDPRHTAWPYDDSGPPRGAARCHCLEGGRLTCCRRPSGSPRPASDPSAGSPG
ncbi:hypothetical protein [Halomonas sp. PBN3]|uniref:hypothetical protein n=1 Tax=Halomonas sp. PBN3 TaxID=1397528 RepID=UPI0012696A22|nr:hypothetical protein [Halomonas sp. PBN3]